uniref:Protein kinase domain-containing protein n=1 Tax=Oryza rufipogon TaxID=4529 RepID=A0A0E0QZ14_ORYRU
MEFLKTITCDFSKEQELGRGGYGVVYKGAFGSKASRGLAWPGKDSLARNFLAVGTKHDGRQLVFKEVHHEECAKQINGKVFESPKIKNKNNHMYLD